MQVGDRVKHSVASIAAALVIAMSGAGCRSDTPSASAPPDSWLDRAPSDRSPAAPLDASRYAIVPAARSADAEALLVATAWRVLSATDAARLLDATPAPMGDGVLVLLRGLRYRDGENRELAAGDDARITWRDGEVEVLSRAHRNFPPPPLERRPVIARLPREPSRVHVDAVVAIVGGVR